MSKLIYKVAASCIALAVLSAGVMAYLIRKVDVERGIIYDGLGRVL